MPTTCQIFMLGTVKRQPAAGADMRDRMSGGLQHHGAHRFMQRQLDVDGAQFGELGCRIHLLAPAVQCPVDQVEGIAGCRAVEMRGDRRAGGVAGQRLLE